MSTQYQFVSKERKKQVSELKQLLETERDALLARLEEFGKSNPLVSEDIEDFAFSLRQCVNSAALQAADDDEHVIGTSTANQFLWYPDGPCRCLEDVEKFLVEHPGFDIEDEYGEPVSLDNFRAALKDVSFKD